MHLINLLAIAAAAFACGLTFQPSTPGALIVAGAATVGWIAAAYQTWSRIELGQRNDMLCDHLCELLEEKAQREAKAASERFRRRVDRPRSILRAVGTETAH